MRKLLFLGGPIFQLPIIEKAKEMGLRVGVVDWNQDAPARTVADDFFCASILNREAVFKIVEQYKPSGVICGACDTSVQTAAAVCEKFHLAGNSLETARNATDKYLMLKAFVRGGVPHPKFQYIVKEEIAQAHPQLSFPLICKPVDSSGSRGINLIGNASEFFEKAHESSQAGKSGDILLEEYLVGNEISVEVIVSDGEPHVLQVTDKITTGAPHFCEIGQSQPAVMSQALRARVEKVAKNACRAVGLVNSPAHVEMKLTQDGPKMVELGARMAGDTISTYLINRSVKGINMSEMAIRIALGEKIEIPPYGNSGEATAIRFIGSKDGVLTAISGLGTVRQLPWLDNVTVFGEVGKRYFVSSSNSDRVGFVVARGKTTEEALNRCTEAIHIMNFRWEK